MNKISGIWRLGEDTIVFGDDALLIGERRFGCDKDGERLYISPDEAEIVVPYRCDGDTLHIDVDGVVSVWSRVVDV